MSAKLLKNGTVITFDNAAQAIKVIPKASILIIGDIIKAIAQDHATLEISAETEIIDVSGKIVSPGFINTHVHVWQTAYRSIAPDVTLVEYFNWVSQSSETAKTAFTPDDIYISSLAGYLEGLNGGVTSYVDHAHNNWSPEIMEKGFDAAVDSGARVWWCYEPFDNARNFPLKLHWPIFERIATKPRPEEVKMGLSYQGLAGTEGEEFEHTREMIKKLKIEAITIHHLGGPWPALYSSPEDLAAKAVPSLNLPIILSHAGYLTETDMSTLRNQNMHISITPESEFHYGHGQTTGHLVCDQASLGVDTAFTFSGDILTQARLWLQRVRDMGFQNHLKVTKGLLPRTTPMSVNESFLLATRQGGRALWREDIGVLQVGAKADVVVFNGDSPNMLGWSNAVAAVMLHANVGDVEHVLVGGQWRKRDFKLVGMKHAWSDVREKFLEAASRIQAQAFPPPEVEEKLWGFKPTARVEEVYSTIRK